MASSWIVKRGEKKRGPFTSPQLKSLADSGQLRRTDLVSRQGANHFVKAEEVKGLFPTLSAKQPAAKQPATKTHSKTKPAAKPQEMDFGVVEIIEDDDPVVVLEESNDDFEAVDFDEDYEEPKPARSRRSGGSNRLTPPARSRGGSSRRSSAPAKPAKARKPVKKTSDDEDEDDDGPWANLAYGVACLAGGICLFIALSNGDPNTWESRRGGLILAILKLMYNIGGKWMVLGLLVCLSGLFFWSAANQLRKR